MSRPAQPNEELSRRARRRCAAKLVERFDAWDLTGALEDIWELVRWLNRYVENDRPVAARQGRGREPTSSTRCSTTSRTACVRSRSRSRAYLPETAPQILDALGQPVELELERVAYGLTPATDGIAAAAPLFPRVDQPTAAA